MSSLPTIRYWNRQAGREEIEKVFNDDILYRLYYTRLGRLAANWVLTRRLFNQCYGVVQDLPGSRRKIAPFVERFGVRLEDFEDRPFVSFNDFFSRKLRPGARHFAAEPGTMPAPCEGRYSAFATDSDARLVPLKGSSVRVSDLLGVKETRWQKTFVGGPVVLARLCPIDYHRFHFPDDGAVVASYRLPGPLHSVNPQAVAIKNDVLWTNERHVTIVESAHFGTLAMVEIGALTAGRIVQTYQPGPVVRGQEKGYFQFGGSAAVMVGQAGRWRPADDLLTNTAKQLETLVLLGDVVGFK